MEPFSLSKKYSLTEGQLRMSLKKVITEVLSVANEVLSETDYVVNQIKDLLKNNNSMILWHGREFTWDGDIIIFSEKYQTHIEIYNYPDGVMPNREFGASISYNNKIFNLSFFEIDGEIDERTFSGSIQHEIEHVYQRIKKGKDLLNDKHQTFYSLIQKNISSLDNNGYDRKFALIGYMSNECEQDAYANELYSFVKNQKWTSKREELIIFSPSYKMLYNLHDAISSIKNEDDLVNILKSEKKFFPRKKEWFIKIGEKAYVRYQNKLNHVIKRLKIDDII